MHKRLHRSLKKRFEKCFFLPKPKRSNKTSGGILAETPEINVKPKQQKYEKKTFP